MATIDDLEARLAALEARIGPAPLAVPPITIGSIADAPQPGSPIASNWANEMTNRIVHRFATVASRDSAWPASTAGVGSVCITLDTNTMWIVSNAAVWIEVKLNGLLVRPGFSNADQSIPTPSYATLTGSLLTATIVAGRWYRYSWQFTTTQNTVGTHTFQVALAGNNHIVVFSNIVAVNQLITIGGSMMFAGGAQVGALPFCAAGTGKAISMLGACSAGTMIINSAAAGNARFALEDVGSTAVAP
jgi:hypothetical protein